MAKTKAKSTKRQKTVKRVKRVQKKKQKRGSNNKGRSKGVRKFYTIGEDAQILKALASDKKKAVTVISKELGVKLNRGSESVRDRIKRYLSKLSTSDVKSLLNHSKRNSSEYAYFKTKGKQKSLDKFSQLAPTLNNQLGKRKPKKKKPKKVSKRASHMDNFEWFKEKIYNRDPYFALEHQVQFLSDLFNNFIENHGIKQKEIEEYVQNTNTECTLEAILNHFNIRL